MDIPDEEYKLLKTMLEEIRAELKGNKNFSNAGLSYLVRIDHEKRIKAIETKLIFMAGVSTAGGALGGTVAAMVFKAITGM